MAGLRGAGAPKVSVLVPVYNVERYLAECLDSLAGQTLGDFEAILIDDGSTDGSPAILERYAKADPRFRVVAKANSGYGDSMNRGLAEARGRYIAILESDDRFAPNALELLHNAAERGEADVAKANFWLYWSTPSERLEPFAVVDVHQAGRVLCPREDPAVFFRKPSIWSGLYRRDFLERNGIRFLPTPGASYQDAGFSFKVWASARRAAFIADEVLMYRQDNESSSVRSASKAFCVCDEYASMGDFLDEHGIEGLGGILERMKLDSYLWNYDRLAGELRRDFVLRASQEFAGDLARGIDWTYFEPGARADLEALVADPMRFDAERESYLKKGPLARYLHLGGPVLVARVALARLRPLRRTDARGAAL